MARAADAPTLSFESPEAWEVWLAEHHADGLGVWIQFYKKAAGVRSLTYAEAVLGALCYGWIDSQARSKDDRSWIQKFGPRRPRSVWSRINTERAEGLIGSGRMQPAGLAEIAAAKKDGRWQRAYSSPSASSVPADFLAALAENKKARSFFESLNKANLYAISYRLETAKKPETRKRRMESILAMLAKGEKFH
jgi:uncharacterized protein YdeI (YjbR/CyaY-like superfamily)